MYTKMNPSNERFQIHYVRGWDKWIVVDLKFNRDNEVRDWRKKGLPGKQPIWKGTQQDAENLALLLNKAQADDNGLVKKAERGQSEYRPWDTKRQRVPIAPVVAFKKCECGARYKGDKHCD